MNGEVRVGRRLGFLRAQNGALAVTSCGTIPAEMWDALVDFQSPLAPLPPTSYPRVRTPSKTPRWNQAPWAREYERKIRLNPARSVTWNFLALDKPGEGIHVMSAVLGEDRIVSWSWLDENVYRPVLAKVATVLNFFGRLVGKIR